MTYPNEDPNSGADEQEELEALQDIERKERNKREEKETPLPIIWSCDRCQLTTTAAQLRDCPPVVLVVDEGTDTEHEMWLCHACAADLAKVASQGQ